MTFGFIPSNISQIAREMVDREKLLDELTGTFKIAIRESALRSDTDADDISNEMLNGLDFEDMRMFLRAYLRGDSAEALRLFCGHIEKAIDKAAELHAEGSLPDAIDNDARDREEKLAARYC